MASITFISLLMLVLSIAFVQVGRAGSTFSVTVDNKTDYRMRATLNALKSKLTITPSLLLVSKGSNRKFVLSRPGTCKGPLLSKWYTFSITFNFQMPAGIGYPGKWVDCTFISTRVRVNCPSGGGFGGRTFKFRRLDAQKSSCPVKGIPVSINVSNVGKHGTITLN